MDCGCYAIEHQVFERLTNCRAAYTHIICQIVFRGQTVVSRRHLADDVAQRVVCLF